MYTILENQFRPDGVINTLDGVRRQNINSALSYFHERYSKMSMNEEFTSVALTCLDANFNQIEHKIVKTMYVAPTEEPTEEVASE